MHTKFQISNGQTATISPVLSFNHYLADIELLELTLDRPAGLTFTLNESGFLMYLSVQDNACQLYYHPKGSNLKNLCSGKQQLLFIHFKPEWLLYKCSLFVKLQAFIALIHQRHQQPVFLPSYAIACSLLNSFKKIRAMDSEAVRDKIIYSFINDCVDKYYRKHTEQNTTGNYHQDKATEIAAFVNENYATELVESVPSLATRFMVSERHLARLAKMAFGIPLHAQVIKIRMSSGLNHLINTDKPIHEIAELVGYRESYYFSKAFKKCFGVSPKYLSKM
ncbi:MAG: helix-turn-helix transcriptional regulator [Bacteroidota bacterium]